MSVDAATANLRVAIVSVGLGRVQRGFERIMGDLFGVVGSQLDLTLYKSAGAQNPREKAPRWLGPVTSIARALPAGNSEYSRDCLAFGLCMLPDLLRRRFDVVHCVDPPLAVVLGRLRRLTRFPARILYTDASVTMPEYYPPADHIHHVCEVHYNEAVQMGIPASRMTLIPLGVHTGRFARTGSRRELRRKYGIADSTFLILAVSAVNRVHKRVDYIIEEASRLEGDILLWIDGHPEDPSVVELAQARLGPRCRITYLPSDCIRELYEMADLLVHASLVESFGLAVVEALSSGLPILVHHSAHFQWLVENCDFLIDMAQPGALANRLDQLRHHAHELQARSQERATTVRRRFDWTSLAPDYVRMYRKVAALSSNGLPQQGCG
jgi:glycosyltransferase involved in cell wall biosynthesis